MKRKAELLVDTLEKKVASKHFDCRTKIRIPKKNKNTSAQIFDRGACITIKFVMDNFYLFTVFVGGINIDM